METPSPQETKTPLTNVRVGTWLRSELIRFVILNLLMDAFDTLDKSVTWTTPYDVASSISNSYIYPASSSLPISTVSNDMRHLTHRFRYPITSLPLLRQIPPVLSLGASTVLSLEIAYTVYGLIIISTSHAFHYLYTLVASHPSLGDSLAAELVAPFGKAIEPSVFQPLFDMPFDWRIGDGLTNGTESVGEFWGRWHHMFRRVYTVIVGYFVPVDTTRSSKIREASKDTTLGGETVEKAFGGSWAQILNVFGIFFISAAFHQIIMHRAEWYDIETALSTAYPRASPPGISTFPYSAPRPQLLANDYCDKHALWKKDVTQTVGDAYEHVYSLVRTSIWTPLFLDLEIWMFFLSQAPVVVLERFMFRRFPQLKRSRALHYTLARRAWTWGWLFWSGRWWCDVWTRCGMWGVDERVVGISLIRGIWKGTWVQGI